MTIYTSICGCLTSRDIDHRDPDYEQAEAAWQAEMERHHVYCCQNLREDGKLIRCAQGDDEHCPVYQGQHWAQERDGSKYGGRVCEHDHRVQDDEHGESWYVSGHCTGHHWARWSLVSPADVESTRIWGTGD